MSNELAMRIFSRVRLTEAVAELDLKALGSYGGGLFRPDRCGPFEPIGTPFDPSDLREPAKWLSRPSGTFMFRKRSALSGVIWNLTHAEMWGTDESGKQIRLNSAIPEREFVNYWTEDFEHKWARKIGVDVLVSYFSEMFRASGADFGLLTTLEDLNAKNYLITPKGKGRSMSYEGLDPSKGVPGLYWVNLFSAEYAHWLGIREVAGSECQAQALSDGALLVRFGQLDDCLSQETLDKQIAVVERLGEQRFFDIRRPDRPLEAPNWKVIGTDRKPGTSVQTPAH